MSEEEFTPEVFNKGDKVYYSLHGPGMIKDVTEKTVLDAKKKYYVIDLLPPNRMTVMVPVDYNEEVGIRKVIEASEVDKVLKVLEESYDVDAENIDWKNRYQINMDKIKSGDIMEIARVTNQLFKRNKKKDLSVMEKKLYEQAYQLIVNEIALARDIPQEEAQDLVSGILN
jgi:CarD family transcriptional regulator